MNTCTRHRIQQRLPDNAATLTPLPQIQYSTDARLRIIFAQHVMHTYASPFTIEFKGEVKRLAPDDLLKFSVHINYVCVSVFPTIVRSQASVCDEVREQPACVVALGTCGGARAAAGAGTPARRHRAVPEPAAVLWLSPPPPRHGAAAGSSAAGRASTRQPRRVRRGRHLQVRTPSLCRRAARCLRLLHHDRDERTPASARQEGSCRNDYLVFT